MACEDTGHGNRWVIPIAGYRALSGQEIEKKENVISFFTTPSPYPLHQEHPLYND